MNLLSPRRKKHSLLLVFPLAAVLAFAVLIAGCSDGQGQTTVQATLDPVTASGSLINTIVVTGTGKITAAPDKATLQIAVENEGTTSAEALDTNSKDTQKILDRLKAEGISEDQIETTGVVVYPNRYYDQQSGQEKTSGYRAQNTLTVTFKDLDAIGDVFAAMTEAGADSIYGPTWELSENSTAISKALTKAIANARAKAEAIAADQGVQLGEALIISESSASNWGPIYAEAAARTEDSSVTPPPIIPQNIEVAASVTVTYRIDR